MQNSMMTSVFERHESQVRSYCRDFPALFHRASGQYLWDTSGRRYIDLLCGAGALNYGHNPPAIVERVKEYLTAGGPIQSLDLHTSAKSAFLERFAEDVLRPRGMSDFVMQFPGPAGTLAVEAALKLARKVTGRSNVIAFTGGFHGASLGSLAATSSPLLRAAAGVALPDVTVLPYDGFLGQQDTALVLEQMLSPGSGVGPPAAVLLETVQGEGGLNTASPQWLTQVRRITTEVGALLVVDDIQAGCGRTGKFFSTDHIPGLEPDLVCLSKALSGIGLPMAMLLIRRDLDQWAPGEHNGTFRGHNLAFVAATAALDYWTDSPSFAEHLTRLSAAIHTDLAQFVAAMAERCGEPVATVVGRGTMSGLRFIHPTVAEDVRRELFRASVIAETSAGGGRVLKLFPPLTISLAEWQTIAATVGDVLLKTAGRPSHGIAA
jgi:diaminobutyrate-2-oxoglutarate transaminase